jgi:hypothetical protein
MDSYLELTLESPYGFVDCRIEPKNEEDVNIFSVTLLYPNIVNGFSRSEIYCHDMQFEPETGAYYFEGSEDIHPKIMKLEKKISDEIILKFK